MKLLESINQLLHEFVTTFTAFFVTIEEFLAHYVVATELFTLAVRWILPLLALLLFFRCIWPLLQVGKEKELWGQLRLSDDTYIPLKHWENLLGRSKFSDIVINLPFVSRSHAVLSFRNGIWSIVDLGSKGGVKVNKTKIEKQEVVNYGDTISLAGADMTLIATDEGPVGQDKKLAVAGKQLNTALTLFLILLFQVLAAIQLGVSQRGEVNPALILTFFLFVLAECLHYLIMRWFSRKFFELELLCFFLCGINLLIVAVSAPSSLYKQLVAILIGMAFYTVLELLIGNLGRAQKVKYVLITAATVLMVLNLAVGETLFGAKNWINLGFITFQPMEFVKIAFVLAGTATLDKLLTTRNMTAFIAFSGACIVTLVLIRDFGTAVVFFGTFMVIAFMHSGDLRSIMLITAAAIFGGIAVVSFMPYIASRFAAWGNVWQFANTSGYQQTRTMIAAASGGLLGVGGGNGYLVRIAAADTDLVFGMISEEWGLLVALTVVLIIVFLAIYAVLRTKSCRSSFYAIAACGAASLFLIQTTLNVLGSVDILPLTGVTIPFVSNGGSSMITSWGLLALIKSADERHRPDKAKTYEEAGD